MGKKMKILLTGAAGMLAGDVIPVLIEAKHVVIKTDIQRGLTGVEVLDISKTDDVFCMVQRIRPDYIFHFAAETDVDLCQKKPEHAFRVNALGTKNMALAAKEFGSRFLYISTANVFNGDKPDPYVESDLPQSINIYGKSKTQGEIEVKQLLSGYFIVRAGWMVGGWEFDKKFVYKIIQQLRQGKEELKAVSDKFGSLTFTRDFAVNLMPLLNTNYFGIYHMANKGTCSRYDIALKIVELMGLNNKVRVIPISSDQFPLPAPRPRSEMLDNPKLNLLGLNNMPHWQESLAEYIKINEDKWAI